MNWNVCTSSQESEWIASFLRQQIGQLDVYVAKRYEKRKEDDD